MDIQQAKSSRRLLLSRSNPQTHCIRTLLPSLPEPKRHAASLPCIQRQVTMPTKLDLPARFLLKLATLTYRALMQDKVDGSSGSNLVTHHPGCRVSGWFAGGVDETTGADR